MDYTNITSVENLFQVWIEFRKGKRKRKDVQNFERNLEDNLFLLHKNLKEKKYKHGSYQSFFVHDPKKRHIHKAEVRDRIVHQLLYKFLYELFNKNFIYDSYSCRLNKGVHKGVDRLEKFTRIVSKNHTKQCWALKLDIKKFFASVNHKVLMELLRMKIKDKSILWLLEEVINSFHSEYGDGKGIPLGNLTSQVFANIYLNELDKFVKHKIKIKPYLRYADDFLIISGDKKQLSKLVIPIEEFIINKLKMKLHPNKIMLRRLDWGIDFLGYTVLPHYRLPKTGTKRRIFKRLKNKVYSSNFNLSLQSYLGYLSHANAYELKVKLINEVWIWTSKPVYFKI